MTADPEGAEHLHDRTVVRALVATETGDRVRTLVTAALPMLIFVVAGALQLWPVACLAVPLLLPLAALGHLTRWLFVTDVEIGLVDLRFRGRRIPASEIRRCVVLARGSLGGPTVEVITSQGTWEMVVGDGRHADLQWLVDAIAAMRRRSRARQGRVPAEVERLIGRLR